MGKQQHNIQRGMKVILRKLTLKSKKHKADKRNVGKMFSIRSVMMDGRPHNQYVASIELSDGSVVALQDIALCNENFEPAGAFTVCLSCNYHFPENELDSVEEVSDRICPRCATADCDSD